MGNSNNGSFLVMMFYKIFVFHFLLADLLLLGTRLDQQHKRFELQKLRHINAYFGDDSDCTIMFNTRNGTE